MSPSAFIAAGNVGPVLTVILCLLLLAAVVVFCALAAKWVMRLLTGWKTLTRRFPLVDVHRLGEKFEATGDFACIRGSVKGFLVELTQEGLLVTARFAAKSPVLIPWPDILQVKEFESLAGWLPWSSGQNIQVIVRYEKSLWFNLPKEALAAIQTHIPAERFHKATSIFDLLSDQDRSKTGAPVPAVDEQTLIDEEAAKVDSWWGALAALMLLQAYSFILLQGIVFALTDARMWVVVPVLLPWFLVIVMAQSSGLRVMNRYLQTHGWQNAVRFLHSPLETFRFWMAVFAGGIYWYLLTGHRPVPADAAHYHQVGIIGGLLFQLFNLLITFLFSRLLKLSAKLESLEGQQAAAADQRRGWTNVIGGVIALAIGISLVAVCFYDRSAFYTVGVFGYGIIVIVLSPALTIDPRLWVKK